jgi:hypothetical protein
MNARTSPHAAAATGEPATVPVPAPSEAPTVPTARTVAEAPTVPTARTVAEAPTVPTGRPLGEVPTEAVPTEPMSPGRVVAGPVDEPTIEEKPRVSGRVIVPGAVAPGQKPKAPAPSAPTRMLDRVGDTAAAAPTAPARRPAPPRPAPPPRPVPARQARPVPAPRRRRGRGRLRRALTAMFALFLLAAVPVVSAYVSYKLASGENPFQWPPTVDYDLVFGR